jgi:hypothetical protein
MFRLTHFWVCFFMIGGWTVAEAASGRIIKVLPHYLDSDGRHTLSPSLFERDAYQEILRANPDQRSARRFDIQWKARGGKERAYRLRVEIRGSKSHTFEPYILEEDFRAGRWFSRWSGVTLSGEPYVELGEVTAWRVTLWDGAQLLDEQRSYLW